MNKDERIKRSLLKANHGHQRFILFFILFSFFLSIVQSMEMEEEMKRKEENASLVKENNAMEWMKEEEEEELVEKEEREGILYSKDFWHAGKKRKREEELEWKIDQYSKPIGWPWKEKEHHLRTIFISIASYRDPSCSSTLIDLFEKSSFPHRIFVGIYQQSKETEENTDCFHNLNQKTLGFLSNMKIMRIDSKDADGPTNARYWCSKMYSGQDYFMQIDSHTRFLEDWDQIQIKMWEDFNVKFPNPKRKLIISGYPMSYNASLSEYPDQYLTWTPCMCNGKFTSGLLIPGGTIVPVGTVYEIPFIGAGWIFGPGRMVQDVPFDNSLPHLFIGEELMHSVRLWTAGYRIFNPSLGILAHYYLRSNQPKVWDDVSSFWSKGEESKEKVRRALLFTEENGPFPKFYPPKYQVEQYYKHFGINVTTQQMRNIC
eukprot:TRINITY_DN2580_c0_g1_i1.p1 TRINITY_DN2580_c0_g1~~TRINITY_DN2580_c0_g1_i1.p1  ORF type:complete len:430 (+),score=163.04 TRINITY_DN2580_c0_g1_i1:90-1379(+)